MTSDKLISPLFSGLLGEQEESALSSSLQNGRLLLFKDSWPGQGVVSGTLYLQCIRAHFVDLCHGVLARSSWGQC